MTNVLPLFQYPTTIAWVDDDEIFLQSIDLIFQGNKKIFSNPNECIAYFNVNKPFSQIAFLHGESNNESYDSLEHAPVDFDVTELAGLHNHAERFQEISVLICDHNMPEMTGLNLCCKLRDFPVKKILLTGEMQNEEAVQAFNTGLIERFIHKYNLNLPTEIPKYITDLTRQYFSELTRPILLHLEADRVLPLSDPAFIAFFDKWCDDNNIKEFYLIDKQGSFLTTNDKNGMHYFVIHTDWSLNNFAKFYSDNAEVKSLIQLVETRSKIPFFGYKKDAWQVNHSEWAKYFYVPDILEGREKYYWKVIEVDF